MPNILQLLLGEASVSLPLYVSHFTCQLAPKQNILQPLLNHLDPLHKYLVNLSYDPMDLKNEQQLTLQTVPLEHLNVPVNDVLPPMLEVVPPVHFGDVYLGSKVLSFRLKLFGLKLVALFYDAAAEHLQALLLLYF